MGRGAFPAQDHKAGQIFRDEISEQFRVQILPKKKWIIQKLQIKILTEYKTFQFTELFDPLKKIYNSKILIILRFPLSSDSLYPI